MGPEVVERSPSGARRQKPNCQIAAIGSPGCGKTVRAKEWLAEGARQGEPAIVHDPNDDFEGIGHRYSDLAEFSRQWDLAAQAGEQVNPVARYGGNWTDIVDFLCDEERGFAVSRQLPTRVVFDEASVTGGSKALSAPLNILMSRRRHWWLKPRFNFQFATQIHFSCINMSTSLELFKISDEYSLTELKRRGVPPDIVQALPHLAPLEYVPFVRHIGEPKTR